MGQKPLSRSKLSGTNLTFTETDIQTQPQSLNSPINQQQTTYKGAFIGVNGDFNLKLAELQKLGAGGTNSSKSMIERKYSDQSYDMNSNNGRRNYMNKLGFNNNGGIVDNSLANSQSQIMTSGQNQGQNQNQFFQQNGSNENQRQSLTGSRPDSNQQTNKKYMRTSTLIVHPRKQSDGAFLQSNSLMNDQIQIVQTSTGDIEITTSTAVDMQTQNYMHENHLEVILDTEIESKSAPIDQLLQSDDISKLEESIITEDKEQVVETFQIPEAEGFALDFISKVRTNDMIRRNFLSKLTYQKIWLTPLEKPKLHESAIIFDWDDTLLCTSFINPAGVYEQAELSSTVWQNIKLLEQTAAKILNISLKHGKTFIITNAAEGWVQFSAKKFMPSLEPILEKITIISARTKYEPHFPGDVTKWKLNAFLETQNNLDEALITNIIALGDSMMEIDAAHHLAMKFQKALIKTVKFREFPKPNELVKQLNLVIQKFEEICNSPKNLTIRLEKQVKIKYQYNSIGSNKIDRLE